MPLIIIPVVLTALTTMIGFLSFIFGAYLSMIRDFGLLAALGTFYAGLLAVVLVPALVAIIPVKEKKTLREAKNLELGSLSSTCSQAVGIELIITNNTGFANKGFR